MRSAELSDNEVAAQAAVLELIYEALTHLPQAFMRELTIGFVRLLTRTKFKSARRATEATEAERLEKTARYGIQRPVRATCW